MATQRKVSITKKLSDNKESDFTFPKINTHETDGVVNNPVNVPGLPQNGLPDIFNKEDDVFLKSATQRQRNDIAREVVDDALEEVDDNVEYADRFEEPDEDSEYDTDLENEDHDLVDFQKLLDLDKSTRSYIQICRQMQIQPNACVKDQLQSGELNLRHTNFSREEIFAILIALCANTTVTSLVLADCHLSIDNLDKLRGVLVENIFIQSIDLSHNNLASAGAQIVGSILERSKNITTVKLSACGFTDADCACVCDPLQDDNRYLVALDLSHNQFREAAGQSLRDLIASNDTIRTLDLSWNHLRRQGATDVAIGLGRNTTMTSLNLAYNGFGDEGAAGIAQALTTNDTLERLNLTNNRISNRGAMRIGDALKKNQTLKVLKISENPISPYGVHFLLVGVRACNSLVRLDIESLPVDLHGMKALCDINKQGDGRTFLAKHGPFLLKETKNYGNPDYVVKMEIFDQIREHLDANNLRMVDLFNVWWKDKDNGGLTVEQLKLGLDAANIPVTKNMLGRVFKAFDKNENGVISYDEFAWGIQ